MPNKATSKSQFRLFKGIAEGSIKPKGTLTKAKAAEMLGEQSPRGLPEKAKDPFGLHKLVKRAKGRFRIG